MPNYETKNVKAATYIRNGQTRNKVVFRATGSGIPNFGGRVPNDRFVPVEFNSKYLIDALRNGDLIEEGSPEDIATRDVPKPNEEPVA